MNRHLRRLLRRPLTVRLDGVQYRLGPRMTLGRVHEYAMHGQLWCDLCHLRLVHEREATDA